jgi:hypothetical protein
MKAKVGNNVVFTRAQNLERVSGQIATIQGVGSKTILLILITFISALATMYFPVLPNLDYYFCPFNYYVV